MIRNRKSRGISELSAAYLRNITTVKPGKMYFDAECIISAAKPGHKMSLSFCTDRSA